MRMAASPAQSFLFTVHVCERVSFAPSDWTYTSSQQPFPASHVKLYYISGRRRFSGAVTLWSKSVCFVLDTLYRQSCGKQLCCNLRSTVRVLTLSLSSLLFVLLLFHSLPSISISITVWQYLSFLERISSPPWGQCDEVKNFHTRGDSVRSYTWHGSTHAPRAQGYWSNEDTRVGSYNKLFSVLALSKHTMTTPAIFGVHRNINFWPQVRLTKKTTIRNEIPGIS